MKKILITGANSYVGMSFENWLSSKWPDRYHVDTIDMIDGSWREKSFAGYDVVFHVAGIAHIKETKKNEHMYYHINRDLAAETARKAKTDGVGQFVFMSSMSVYGMTNGIITKVTKPYPVTNYGQSKLQAEELISKIADHDLIVTILKPPMIYGKGCRGNYQKLSRLVQKLPIFPKVDTVRSMVYIENLCDSIKMLIDKSENGIFVPQNSYYVNISNMASIIAKCHGKKLRLSKYLLPVVQVVRYFVPNLVDKAFGSLIFVPEEGSCLLEKSDISLEQSIFQTEMK